MICSSLKWSGTACNPKRITHQEQQAETTKRRICAALKPYIYRYGGRIEKKSKKIKIIL